MVFVTLAYSYIEQYSTLEGINHREKGLVSNEIPLFTPIVNATTLKRDTLLPKHISQGLTRQRGRFQQCWQLNEIITKSRDKVLV